ncbi:MAG TPA: hypothetical protein VF170_17835 [Planctomycetaceae bacterium]
MTPDARREALTALAELSDAIPEVRIGQLVAHLGFLSEDHGGRGLGDIEDDELLAVIRRHREEVAQLSSREPDRGRYAAGAS